MVPRRFIIQPCFRCHEFAMKLLGISPNGRSVHYRCSHCEKKMRAPAGTPDADRAIGIWIGLCQAVEEYNARPDRSRAGAGPIEADVQFDAPPAPLPFEQTTRSPIPEAVGGEVWRRDGAACVRCGSKQTVQFDHIIPVALGGATSAANLQLLCQPCNAAKGMRI